jgi:hypothetical protein
VGAGGDAPGAGEAACEGAGDEPPGDGDAAAEPALLRAGLLPEPVTALVEGAGTERVPWT